MAVILYVEAEGETLRQDALAIDLSPMGARLQAGAQLSPGQVVEVVPGEGSDPVSGRVVWVGKPASDMEGQAGLEFLGSYSPPT
jgi:hypothetical protein